MERTFVGMTEKTSHFGQNVRKYRLMNTVTVNFNATVRQMTEIFFLSQQNIDRNA